MSVFEGINYFCHDMLMLAPAIVNIKYFLFYSKKGKGEDLVAPITFAVRKGH